MTSDSIKKVPFLAWIKWNAERMRSCCDWFRSASLNTVLLNWFIKDLIQIYGQSAILADLSVKPGPKRLNFYGQTAVFDHFVRNRYFSDRPFTDSMPIFIDLSVNGSDFAKCSAAHHLLNRCTWLRLRAPSFGVGGRQKSHIHPGFCLFSGPHGPNL